jgi:hypothetical protein
MMGNRQQPMKQGKPNEKYTDGSTHEPVNAGVHEGVNYAVHD